MLVVQASIYQEIVLKKKLSYIGFVSSLEFADELSRQRDGQGQSLEGVMRFMWKAVALSLSMLASGTLGITLTSCE